MISVNTPKIRGKTRVTGDIREGGKRLRESFSEIPAESPALSIVTVVRNGDRFIEQTINSVLSQTCEGIEYIVIDGGSSDDTVPIIKSYDASLDYWLSEPDSGIADAMNKGLSLCHGRYIMFLHADDYLKCSDSIATALDMMNEQPDIAAFALDYDTNGKRTKRVPRGFGPWLNFKTGLFHQAVLCKHQVFEELGPFDTDFTIAMDYEYWLRAYRHGIKPCLYEHTISVMRDTGISAASDWPTLRTRFSEERMVHHKHSRSLFDKMTYGLYWSLYFPYRFLRQHVKTKAD